MSLPTPTSRDARERIRQVCGELAALISPAESRDFEVTTIYDVRKACETIESELASRSLMRNLRRLLPFFTGMQHFSKSIDVLCNGTPFLPWAWAPITVILKIASDYVEAFEVLVKVYAQIGESLGRFERLGRVFAKDHGMQEILAVFYCDILRFHKLAYKSVKRSSWKILFTTTWGRFERRFGTIIENMKRHGDLIEKEAVARHIDAAQLSIFETRASLKNLESSAAKQLEEMEKAEKETSARQFVALVPVLQLNETDQVTIFDAHLLEDRYDGTCSWALQQKQVKAWLGPSDRPRSLWLHGKPGSGKSVLAAHLINFQSNRGLTVIYHFCADDYPASKAYDQILRSFIRQLIQKSDEATAHAYKIMVLDRKPAKIADLERLVQDLVIIASDGSSDKGSVWIVVDGIEASQPNKLSKLSAFMRGLASKTTVQGRPVCKVLLLGRHSQSVSKDLGKIPEVSLEREKNSIDNAIRAYVSQRLHDKHSAARLRALEVGDTDVDTIISQVTSKSDGMFLYAKFILDFLMKQWYVSKEELLVSVKKMPPTLEEYYEKIIKQIVSHLDKQSSDRLRCVLRWAAFSRRPLKQLEFLSAVTFSSGNPGCQALAPGYFLEDCAGLVVERHDATFGFIHPTVKEFLISGKASIPITEKDGILEQALATMACLLAVSERLGPEGHGILESTLLVKGLFGLAIYASQYWCDSILALVGTSQTQLVEHSQVAFLVQHLSHELDKHADGHPDGGPSEGDHSPDQEKQIQGLSKYPGLLVHARDFFACRSVQGLEKSLASNEDGDDPNSRGKARSDGTSKIMSIYQSAIRRLLHDNHHPGVSAEAFNIFKMQLGLGAYTCGLRTCPFAAGGIRDQRSLLEHELAHSRRPRCPVFGCPFPPFSSEKRVEAHIRRHHSITPAAKKPLSLGVEQTDLKSDWVGTVSPYALTPSPQIQTEFAFDNFYDFDWTHPSTSLIYDSAGFDLFDSTTSPPYRPGPWKFDQPVRLGKLL